MACRRRRQTMPINVQQIPIEYHLYRTLNTFYVCQRYANMSRFYYRTLRVISGKWKLVVYAPHTLVLLCCCYTRRDVLLLLFYIQQMCTNDNFSVMAARVRLFSSLSFMDMYACQSHKIWHCNDVLKLIMYCFYWKILTFTVCVGGFFNVIDFFKINFEFINPPNYVYYNVFRFAKIKRLQATK